MFNEKIDTGLRTSLYKPFTGSGKQVQWFRGSEPSLAFLRRKAYQNRVVCELSDRLTLNVEPRTSEPLNLQLQLFPAIIAIHRISQVVIAAGRTRFGLGFVCNGFSATGAKFGTWGQVFAAAGALIENDLLMSALVAKLGVNRYGLIAFRT